MRTLKPLVAAIFAVGIFAIAAFNTHTGALAASRYTCTGGSIPAGTYSSLYIDGPCSVDDGSVTVTTNIWVHPGAALIAAFGGSDLHVGGNVTVMANAILVLGCEPGHFPCFNDPDQEVGTMSTNHVIGGNLSGQSALAMITHNNTIHGNVMQFGGGGGISCAPRAVLQGAPAYSVYEDSAIGGQLHVMGVHTCWLGVFRNDVSGNVVYMNNITDDPDGNEIATNTVAGKLLCFNNDPTVQFGDSGGDPNDAARGAKGQCADVTD